MAFTVVYDACVLYPAPLRDLLLRVAMTSTVRARWSEAILDECFRSILEQRPDLSESALGRTRDLMTRAVPDCLIDDYQNLIDGLALPDPDDRHVLAAAIRAGAQAIVTFNLKDFPATALSKYGVEALHPDDFLLDLIDLAPGTLCAAVMKQASALRRPSMTIGQVLDTLLGLGLVESVAKLRSLLA
jgi:predicted nucleic acid-binding protein